MPPIKTLSEPFHLMRSLSVRVGGNATERAGIRSSIYASTTWSTGHTLHAKLLETESLGLLEAGTWLAKCHPSRNGADQHLLSGVRRKLNRGDNRSRVYQPHRWLRPLSPVESSPSRRSCRVGEGGQQVIFSRMLSSTDCKSVCVRIRVCVIDWRFYLTACCSWCLLLCGHQQVSLLGFGRVPVDICPSELRLLFSN